PGRAGTGSVSLARRRDGRAHPLLRLPRGHDALGQPAHVPAGRELREPALTRVGPHGADVARRVAELGEARDLHDVARVRGLDEPAAPDVDPDVAGAERAGLEEDEVPGRELLEGHGRALVVLRAAEVEEVDAELPV